MSRFGNAAVIVWLAFAVFANSGGLSYTNYRVSHVVVGALLAGYGLSLLIRRKLPGPTPLDLPVAALLAVNALSIALSPYTGVSLEASLEMAAIVVVFYALVDSLSMETETLVRAFVFVGVLLALAGIISFAALYVQDLALKQATLASLNSHEWLPKWYRPKTFYHPNILASAMDLALPFALAMAMYAPSRPSRMLTAVAGVLCLVTLAITDSRGAWLGLVAAAPVFSLLTLSPVGRDVVVRTKRLVTEHGVFIAGTLALAGLAVIALLAALWVVQPPWLFRSTAGSRFELLRAAIRLIGSRPFLGYGPQTSLGLLTPSYNLNHAHNLYVDVVLGGGLAGLAAAVFFGGTVVRVLKAALCQATQRRRAIAAACAAALVSLLVQGLVDVPLHWPGYVLLVAVVLAIAVRLADMHIEVNRAASYLARGAVVALIPVCLFAWQRSDAAQSHYAESQKLAARGDLTGAASQAEVAASSSRGSIVYQLNAGIIETQAYQQSLDAGQPDASRLGQALDYLNAAAVLDSRSAVVYANLAQAERLANNKEAAAAAASKALDLAPGNLFLKMLKDPSLPLAAGNVLEWAGQDDAAVAAYAEAIRVEPSVAAAAYWSTSPQRTEMRRQAVALAGVSPCLVGRAVALYGSSTEELPSLISQCQADARTGAEQAALAIMLQADGRHDEALEQARVAAKSGAPEAHIALGYVVAGDDPEQARHEFLAADGIKDGPLLLAFTYDTGVVAPANSAALHTAKPLPGALEKRLEADTERQPSPAGVAYFMTQLRRMQPETSLIPGEWLELMPPRISVERAIVSASGR